MEISIFRSTYNNNIHSKKKKSVNYVDLTPCVQPYKNGLTASIDCESLTQRVAQNAEIGVMNNPVSIGND